MALRSSPFNLLIVIEHLCQAVRIQKQMIPPYPQCANSFHILKS